MRTENWIWGAFRSSQAFSHFDEYDTTVMSRIRTKSCWRNGRCVRSKARELCPQCALNTHSWTLMGFERTLCGLNSVFVTRLSRTWLPSEVGPGLSVKVARYVLLDQSPSTVASVHHTITDLASVCKVYIIHSLLVRGLSLVILNLLFSVAKSKTLDSPPP